MNNKGLTDAGKKDIFYKGLKAANIMLYQLDLKEGKSWLKTDDIPSIEDTIRKYEIPIDKKDLTWFEFEAYDNTRALKILREFDSIIQDKLDIWKMKLGNLDSEIQGFYIIKMVAEQLIEKLMTVRNFYQL